MSENVSGGVIDHNVTIPSNFEGDEYVSVFGVKKLYVKDGALFFRRRVDGRAVAIYLLHFQGQGKRLMGSVIRKRRLQFVVISCMIKLARSAKSINRLIRR